jgi:hypothetical protein
MQYAYIYMPMLSSNHQLFYSITIHKLFVFGSLCMGSPHCYLQALPVFRRFILALVLTMSCSRSNGTKIRVYILLSVGCSSFEPSYYSASTWDYFVICIFDLIQ